LRPLQRLPAELVDLVLPVLREVAVVAEPVVVEDVRGQEDVEASAFVAVLLRLKSQPRSGMWDRHGTPWWTPDLSCVTMPPITIVPPLGTMISLVVISRDVLGGGMFGSGTRG
jgi:hypothetical protein